MTVATVTETFDVAPAIPGLLPRDEPEAIRYGEALRAIMNRDFCFSEKYQEQQTRAHRDGAHDEILDFERLLVKRLRKFGVPVFAHCVWRSRHDQNALWVAGNSRAKGGQSPHNFGCAVDIIHGLHGWSIPAKSWEMIGHMGKELAASKGWKIEWGGDWSFFDPAHWQLANWRLRASEIASSKKGQHG